MPTARHCLPRKFALVPNRLGFRLLLPFFFVSTRSKHHDRNHHIGSFVATATNPCPSINMHQAAQRSSNGYRLTMNNRFNPAFGNTDMPTRAGRRVARLLRTQSIGKQAMIYRAIEQLLIGYCTLNQFGFPHGICPE